MVHVVFLIDPIPVVELERFIPICYKLHAFRFLTAYFLRMLRGAEKKKIPKHFSLKTQTMLWSKSHCSDEFLSHPVTPCIKTQLLCKLLLTRINGGDFALSVLFAIHRTECTTGCKFTLINCFQVLWKRKKTNQEEYQHCLARRLPLNTVSKCERLHLKLIAMPRLFRKIWQQTIQQKGIKNNNGKHLRKRPYHFHTGGQHHLGCINTVASQTAAVLLIL